MSFKKILGWSCSAIAFFALFPSVVPGAMAILVYYLSIIALIGSVISIIPNNQRQFKITAAIVLFTMCFINDYLRVLYQASHGNTLERSMLFCVYLIVVGFGYVKSKKQ
ncbi:hypothetical protein ACSLBF_20160 (plasmid) [Pseudoalteromonas sp. T1lg65]|uniref:hypothetical protein n=1 Tax=Pseudoalteromonas sp. T1lg65 TaxID=2077101 RepID=UPI003F7A0672